MFKEIQRRVETFQHHRAETQWRGQIQRLITLGFHLQLGSNVSEAEYRNSMPAFTQRPTEAGKNFMIPLLVDPRISLFRQLLVHGVIPDVDVLDADIARISLAEESRDDIPKHPYQIWVNSGSKQRGTADFRNHERGLTVIETLALLREKPRLFRGKIYDTGNILFGPNNQGISVVNVEKIICANSFLRSRWLEQNVLAVYRWGSSRNQQPFRLATIHMDLTQKSPHHVIPSTVII